MKTIASEFRAHLQGERLSTALCWVVTKRTGGTVRGTEHDRDLEITTGDFTGTYRSLAQNISGSDVRSTSDLSVDNLEVQAAGVDDAADGITFAEIEAGALDNARVTVFVCNWADPDGGQVIVRRGYIGEVSRDTDVRLQTEIRGLAQLLIQQIGRVLSDRCDVARFGDTRCGFDVDAITSSGTVTQVTSRKQFRVTFGSANWDMLPAGGEGTFTTGDNDGFTKEVKTATEIAANELELVFYEEFAEDVEVGDAIDFVPGCDRLYSTCKARANLANFRGFGIFVPGALALMRGPFPGDCEVVLPDVTSSGS